MHIILVSNRLATAKTLNITLRSATAVAVGFVCLSFATSFVFSWIGFSFNMPFAAEFVASLQKIENQQAAQIQEIEKRKTEEYVRNNVSLMAGKLGEMQAQLMRLDLLGERISKISGVSVQKVEGKTKPGEGGPLIPSSQPVGTVELQREIDRLAEIIEQRTDALTALESQLMERRIKTSLLPTIVPIEADHVGSTFGPRIDPIAGISARHEGIDFVADTGTRVIASAGGIVQVAEYHPQYGNLIEIDHGNDFSSRYAHLSKTSVKPGQIVKRGQSIGASGNTGRSTGPHLHFEVRFKGIAQNPSRFLQQGTRVALGSPVPSKSGLPPEIESGAHAVSPKPR